MRFPTDHPPNCGCAVCECECVEHCPVHPRITHDEWIRAHANIAARDAEVERLRTEATAAQVEYEKLSEYGWAQRDRVAKLEATLRLARDQLDMQRPEQAYEAIHNALEQVSRAASTNKGET
jgi:hypothetical protein